MTAIAATTWKTNMSMRAMVYGPYNSPGSKIAVVKVVPGTGNYTAGGVTLDLSGIFAHRLYWCVPINPTAIDDSTGFLQHGYVPGTAKTDRVGGFSPSDGKYVMSTGATEMTASDQSAHVLYYLACGY